MGKIYLFNNEQYNSLNELGIAYSQDFELGLTDVFSNTKKLIKFVKSIDKKLAREVVSIITSCKYKNNVLTFLIFNFCNDKRVIINGEQYDFRLFVDKLKTYGAKHKAIYAFMEDCGISKTFGVLNTEPNLTRDAYFIEKNINDPFVYDYLTTYYQYDYVESLHSFISNVFIYNDERFRRAAKVFKNDRFELILSHKVGFKEVFELRYSDMPVFKGVKLLIGEFDEKDLKKLLDDTFYWWLWNNLDKYSMKKEAKKAIMPSVKKVKKAYAEYERDPKLLAYIDICEELYELYVDFVEFMKKGLIKVKKKYDQELYVLDKLYCNTFISTDFMKNNAVKLQRDNIETPVEIDTDDDVNEANESTEEKVDPIDLLNEDDEEFTPVSNRMSKKEIKREDRRISRLKRYANCSMVFIVLFAVICAVIFALGNVLEQLKDAIGLVELIIVLAASFVGVILCGVAKFRIAKTEDALNDIVALDKYADRKVELSAVQERAYIKLKENEESIKQKAKRTHRIITAIINTCLAVVSAAIGIYLFTFLSDSVSLFADWDESYINNNIRIIYLLVAPVLGLGYGILRKKKGAITALLMILLAIASVLVLSLVL